MYISGTIADFASRLHALPYSLTQELTSSTGALFTGAAQLALFIEEGRNYLSTQGVGAGLNQISVHLSGQWEREARLAGYRLSGEAYGTNNQML